MKVLHINCNYIGTALHRLLIRRLRESGGEHLVFVPSDGRAAWKSFVPEAGEVVSECFKRFDRYIYFKKQAQIRRSAEKAYDISSFDCIHAYTLFTDGNCAMALSKKYGIPYVVAVRNTDVNGFFKRRRLLRRRGVRIMRSASAVFFLSEGYREKTLTKYVPERFREEILRKSRIIPNGIDSFWLENIAPLPDAEKLRRIRGGELKMLCVGRVTRWKDPTPACRAVEELCRRGYRASLTVIGKVEIPEIVEELKKSPVFTYLPPRPKEELIKVYREHDIFVLPSRDETFGLVYPEAMTQRLPVLYSKNEGFDGQFPDGEAGYAVDPFSAEDIAEKLLLAVKNYEEIIERAPTLARRFDWTDIAKQYSTIYKSFLS